MEGASMTLELGVEPTRRRKIVSDGVLGMTIFVFSEVMFFAGLISAFVIIKSQAAGRMWPPFGQPRLPAEETAINTAALLLSGVVLFFAQRAFAKKPDKAVWPFAASIALGVFFVGFQGAEWVGLLAEGLTMQSSSYGAFFYLIVGTHALHAVIALSAMVWAWARLKKESLSQAQFATVQVFWYFVVLVWPALYWKVYL
jgi:cytochrome c oxidase subunit III